MLLHLTFAKRVFLVSRSEKRLDLKLSLSSLHSKKVFYFLRKKNIIANQLKKNSLPFITLALKFTRFRHLYLAIVIVVAVQK
jgi:hypothetical protein